MYKRQKLTDDVDILCFGLFRSALFFEGQGTTFSNGAQVLLQLLFRHATAIVPKGKGAFFRVQCDVDGEIIPGDAGEPFAQGLSLIHI